MFVASSEIFQRENSNWKISAGRRVRRLIYRPFFSYSSYCVETRSKSYYSLRRWSKRYIVKGCERERKREEPYKLCEAQYRNLIILPFVLLILATAIARRRCIMHTRTWDPGLMKDLIEFWVNGIWLAELLIKHPQRILTSSPRCIALHEARYRV